jgi:uncharacterized protein with NRDE domain
MHLSIVERRAPPQHNARMCLIAFAWRSHAEHDLVLIANRDEFYARPSRALHQWDGEAGIIAGRDLEGGGSWLGVAVPARIAAVTNYRDPLDPGRDRRSRGELVQRFLETQQPAQDFARRAYAERATYRGFNLLLGDGEELWYVGSRAPGARRLDPGVYGISNALLDTPWPKLRRATEAMRAAIAQLDPEQVLRDAFGDRGLAPDEALPDTGVGLDWERALSPPFIRTERYGTRGTTYVAMRGARLRIRECCYAPDGRIESDTAIER